MREGFGGVALGDGLCSIRNSICQHFSEYLFIRLKIQGGRKVEPKLEMSVAQIDKVRSSE